MRGMKLAFHCFQISLPFLDGIPRLEDESRRVVRVLEFLDLRKHGIDDERVFILNGDAITATPGIPVNDE